MKKTIWADLLLQDISDLKAFCSRLHITSRKIAKIEKKYSKSRYVLSDFWNSYFKSKKVQNIKLQRRNSMPQSQVDQHQIRRQSRSQNCNLMTLQNNAKNLSHGLNNSLIISMKIQGELKAVQSDRLITQENHFSDKNHNTIHPLQKQLLFSIEDQQSLQNSFISKKSSDTKTGVSSQNGKKDSQSNSVDFIEQKTLNVVKKFNHLHKKDFLHHSNILSNQNDLDNQILKRFKTSKKKPSENFEKNVKFNQALPMDAFLKKSKIKLNLDPKENKE